MHEALKPRSYKHFLIGMANLTRLVASNIGLVAKPDFSRIYDDCVPLLVMLWDAPDRIVYEGTEHVVQEGPVIYAANHIKLDDPLLVAYGIWVHSESNRHVRFMMRDDFFGDRWYLKTRILDLDRFTEEMGAIQISREDVKIGQIRLFLRVLKEGGSFIVFPSWTRSKTGKFIELPEDAEIGNVAFFVSRGAGKKRERGSDEGSEIPVVPVVRSFNLASKRSIIRFGAPLHFSEFADNRPRGEDIDVRKLFNRSVVDAMSELVVINAAQLASFYLLQYIEHGLRDGRTGSHDTVILERRKFRSDLRSVVESLSNETRGYIDGRLEDNFDAEIDTVENFLGRVGMWSRSSPEEGSFALDVARICCNPEPAKTFKKENPVRYLANQITHFPHIKPLIGRVL